MKRIRLLALSVALLFAGCGAQEAAPSTETTMPQKTAASMEIEYSNLVEPQTQKDLGQIMTMAGISQDQQNNLFTHVDQINALLGPEERTEGYETGDSPKYDPFALQEAWNAQYPDFLGYNCRITAYSLFRNFLTVPQEAQGDITLFDMQALQEDPSAFPGQEKQFASFYANVPTTASKDVREHVDILKKDWERRGIEFTDDPNVRLISVMFHDLLDPENPTLFVGHTGVLFPITPQEFLFLEKLSFQEPYQCVRFDSRRELNDYLMGKYDLDFDQPNAAPFIMENDELMEDYRQLP